MEVHPHALKRAAPSDIDRRVKDFGGEEAEALEHGFCVGEFAKTCFSVKERAEPVDIAPPAVTRDRKVLQRAGLIIQGREKQWRPCRLRPPPLKEAADRVETCRQLWEQRLDRLEDYLRELQHKEK